MKECSLIIMESHLVFIGANDDGSCQKYYWMSLFACMVSIVICWIFVSDSVEGVFHCICTGVVLLRYHLIWIGACIVRIILLV